jgi:regulator of replication initiation timing
MKLIFKIFRKVRKLKRELKKEEIELSEKITSLLIEKTRLETDIEQLKKERLGENDYIHWRDAKQNERETRLDQREKELNTLQEKLNDQILKLGIVKGVNNEN